MFIAWNELGGMRAETGKRRYSQVLKHLLTLASRTHVETYAPTKDWNLPPFLSESFCVDLMLQMWDAPTVCVGGRATAEQRRAEVIPYLNKVARVLLHMLVLSLLNLYCIRWSSELLSTFQAFSRHTGPYWLIRYFIFFVCPFSSLCSLFCFVFSETGAWRLPPSESTNLLWGYMRKLLRTGSGLKQVLKHCYTHTKKKDIIVLELCILQL